MAVWRGHIWPAKRPFYSTLIFRNAYLSNQLCKSDRGRELQTLTRVLLSLILPTLTIRLYMLRSLAAELFLRELARRPGLRWGRVSCHAFLAGPQWTPTARAYRLVCIPEEDVPIRGEWVRYWVEGDGTDGSDGTDGKHGGGEARRSPATHGGGEARRSPATHGGGEPRRSPTYEQVIMAVDPAVCTALVTLGWAGNNEIQGTELVALLVPGNLN